MKKDEVIHSAEVVPKDAANIIDEIGAMFNAHVIMVVLLQEGNTLASITNREIPFETIKRINDAILPIIREELDRAAERIN